ncbi:uncharacterized protein MYCGRDRAFT_106049 [Zymoseptoria tritici IPO323]|uniref:Uncharacterized protein n=1 Tax=Zymoseptoria tritici (strain CBS 115943 / IPO323) TaxID=336722 RepID=F9XMG6_ZYMTI|nr:uncharacterized protein MYCGRDRAFT_106049 [Zymoseptoria tritici IPO323]EGP83246.1 hypothetical protein MYCGRDRAFT_106049 [Zymoseptoria tritici IPO323]
MSHERMARSVDRDSLCVRYYSWSCWLPRTSACAPIGLAQRSVAWRCLLMVRVEGGMTSLTSSNDPDQRNSACCRKDRYLMQKGIDRFASSYWPGRGSRIEHHCMLRDLGLWTRDVVYRN